MYNNHCPYKYKHELVNWLVKFCDNNNIKTTKTRVNKRTIKQLRWLYYNLPGIVAMKRKS